jgi:predicted RNA-binding protein with PIN domain
MILIDGHNLIPKIRGLSLKMLDDEMELIQILSDYARLTRKKLDVYFDNAPFDKSGTRKFGAVTAHFVREGTTADDAIIQRISKLKRRTQNTKVISSDQRVQHLAKLNGAQVISSDEFSKEIEKVFSRSPSGGKPDPERLSPTDIDHWMQIFTNTKKKD